MIPPSAIALSCKRMPAVKQGAPLQAVENLAERRRYYLEVEIQVPADRKQEFASKGQEFLPNFEQAQLKLAVSAWQTDTGPIFAVNYWDMGGDANVLLEAELALPDVVGFNEFNALVQSEVKNIVVPIAHDPGAPLPDTEKTADGKFLAKDYRYLRVVSSVPAPRLPEFVARIEGQMEHFTHRTAGWFLGNSYLGITGRDGTVSQIWLVPAGDIPNIAEKLRQAPWLRADVVRTAPIFQVLRSTPSDPLLETSEDV
jgi:hypothetical protein